MNRFARMLFAALACTTVACSTPPSGEMTEAGSSESGEAEGDGDGEGEGSASGETTDTEGTSETDEPVEPVTYYQHLKPILDARCANCHLEDGVGPFALDNYEDASVWGTLSLEAVEARIMPPFRADDSDCQPISDIRKMADWERELLAAWVEQDTPEGDPDAPAEVEVEVPANTLGAPDSVHAGVVYEPLDIEEDEYRCFLVDPQLSDPWTFLKAVSIETDNWARVHHAIVYIVPPSLVPVAEAVDAAEPGEGWPCYFGTQVEGSIGVGGHSPGAAPRAYDDGTTVPIEAGTQFIIESHFHATYNEDPVRLDVATWEFDEPVTRFPQWLPMFNSDFVIPAGEPSVTAPLEAHIIPIDQEPVVDPDPNAIKQGKEGLIWGVDFHMHLRGKTARIELVHDDGTSECLLWVPDWSDDWQGSYAFEEPVLAVPGDRIVGTCEWDNSAENQPFVDGVQLEPQDLHWGFDALDEMCNGGVSMTID